MLHLKVISGRDSGSELTTSDRTVTIGRSQGCDLTINETAVSQAHGRLTRVQQQLIYTDTNSHNGSRILFSDGGRLNLGPLFWDHEVDQGDIIQVGSARIKVVSFRPTSRFDDSASDYTMIGSQRELIVA